MKGLKLFYTSLLSLGLSITFFAGFGEAVSRTRGNALALARNSKCENHVANFDIFENSEGIDLGIDMYFLLYTSENWTPTKINLTDIGTILSNFIPSAPTKIICHGLRSDALKGPGGHLVSNYMKQSKKTGQALNVILVDWSKVASTFATYYSRASPSGYYVIPLIYTFFIGQATASLIRLLVACEMTSVDKIHLIGHSLGAHTMGYAGMMMELPSDFETEKLGKVFRLTALDPAGPCFEESDFWNTCSYKNAKNGQLQYEPLDKTYAEFVDVIHTNGGNLGMTTAVGHVDFYPNGGRCQPGCHGLIQQCFMMSSKVCSHGESYELFADTIINPPEDFPAIPCDSVETAMKENCQSSSNNNSIGTVYFGEYCDQRSRGIFYFKTGENSPYSPITAKRKAAEKGGKKSWWSFG